MPLGKDRGDLKPVAQKRLDTHAAIVVICKRTALMPEDFHLGESLRGSVTNGVSERHI